MRHRKTGLKLNRTSSHRNAMFRNMVTSLFKHDRIRTTDVKAKELRRWADNLITLAKRGDVHARRHALSIIREKNVVHKLFSEANERYGSVSGGYTRIVKLGRRAGDAAPISLIELIFSKDDKKKKKVKKKKKDKITLKKKESVDKKEIKEDVGVEKAETIEEAEEIRTETEDKINEDTKEENIEKDMPEDKATLIVPDKSSADADELTEEKDEALIESVETEKTEAESGTSEEKKKDIESEE
jgi:large subunit ribosomal protein L17